MKNKFIFLKLSTIIILSAYSTHLESGFAGYSALEASNKYEEQQRAALLGQTAAAAAAPGNCPSCSSCCNGGSAILTTYVPTFIVQLNDVNGNVLNGAGHLFNTPTTGFNLQTTVFSVHIFPKSNAITSSGVTYATNDGTYIIAYTLKDPAGSIIYKEFDQGLTLAGLPHQITLVPTPTTTPATTTSTSGTPQAAIWTTVLSPKNTPMIANSIFIPNLRSIKTQALRQQIINGISPISQKFLFTQNGSNNISATTISGTFDADNSAQTASYSYTGTSSAVTTTTGTSIGQFAISFDDGQTQLITFTNPSQIAFNQGDIAKGLILNVCIFPSAQAQNYPVIATLRSTDGLKLQKSSAIYNTQQTSAPQPTNYLQSLPSTISIQYSPYSSSGQTSFTTQLTTSFFNSASISQNNTAMNQALTIDGVLNLRFVIFRPQAGNIMINMV